MKQRTNKKFKSVNEKSWYGLFYGQEPRDKTNIKKVIIYLQLNNMMLKEAQ